MPEAELKLDFGGWLLPSRHLLNLHVRGLQLDLLHDAGGWHVNGIGVAGGGNRQPVSLGRISVDLWLEDLRVAGHRCHAAQAVHLAVQTIASELIRVTRSALAACCGVMASTAAVHTAGRFREDGRSGQVWTRCRCVPN